MGIRFEIDAEEGIIYSIAEGQIGPEDLRGYAKNLLADPKFHTNLGEIIEFRLAGPNISDEEVEALASNLLAVHPRKLAMVFVIGSARKLGLRYKELVRDKMVVEVFTDLKSARKWEIRIDLWASHTKLTL